MLGYGLAGTIVVVLLIVVPSAASMNPKLWARAKRAHIVHKQAAPG